MPAKSHKISNEYTSINEVKLLRAGRWIFQYTHRTYPTGGRYYSHPGIYL